MDSLYAPDVGGDFPEQLEIVHLAFSQALPGAGRAAHRLGIGQSNLGARVHYVSLDLNPIYQRVARQMEILPKRFLWKFFPSVATATNPDSSLGWFGLANQMKDSEITADIIQLHWICGGFMRPENLPAFRSFPIVWRLADMWAFCGSEHYTNGDERYVSGYWANNRPPGEKGPDVNRWVWNRKRRAYAQLPDLTIVAPSRWMADCASRSLLLKDRRIEHIATGTDLEIYRPHPQDQARAALGLPREDKIVLFGSVTGTAAPRKGFRHLVGALEHLKQREPDQRIRLITFGSHPSETNFQLPWPVTGLGKIEDEARLALIYAAADVFVAPSREENLANTVLESLACGTPVVAFDIGGMPDAIDASSNGYLAAPFDDEGLAGGIAKILGQKPAQRVKMRKAARSKAERSFDQVTQAKLYLELYQDILSRRLSQRSASPRGHAAHLR